MEYQVTVNGNTFDRIAWMGGSSAPHCILSDKTFRAIRKVYWRESVRECGGLDLWECAGTSALERARIFWRHATADAWATIRASKRNRK